MYKRMMIPTTGPAAAADAFVSADQAEALAVSTIESPVGPLSLVVCNGKLCRILFGAAGEIRKELTEWAHRFGFPAALYADGEPCAEAASQLQSYFAGKRKNFTIPLLLAGTSFQLSVWACLRDIPYGQTRTYKSVAEAIGRPKAVRAVGMANNRNPIPIVIPCHRVIGSNGSLVGYGGGLDKKERLLRLENGASVTQTG